MNMHRSLWQQDTPGSSRTSSEGAYVSTNWPFLRSKARTPRAARPPWVPRFSVALRILLIFRVTAAMYSNIQDCDEGLSIRRSLGSFSLSDLSIVFNYWEPLHYLYKGYGFQTWETSPQYAIRSWAYTLLWLFPSKVPFWVLRETGKVSS